MTQFMRNSTVGRARRMRWQMWLGDALTGIVLVAFIVLFWLLGEVLNG